MVARNHSQNVGDFTITTVVNSPPWYENCFVVQHRPSNRQFVIDPGGEANRIAAVVLACGDGTREILLTHGHPDHLGGVHDLQKLIDAPCRAHQEERMIIDGVADWAGALMQRRITGPEEVTYFSDEPVLTYDSFDVRVLFTPGHTPGGVCYVFDGFVFTGDTLFNQGVGRTDLPGGSGRQLSASITRLLRDLDPALELFCGHGPSWTIGEARGWWELAVSQGYF